MRSKAQTATSNLNLVNSVDSDSRAAQDIHDGIKMADLVESLDTRELDIGEGEDVDYDGNNIGKFMEMRKYMCLPIVITYYVAVALKIYSITIISCKEISKARRKF